MFVMNQNHANNKYKFVKSNASIASLPAKNGFKLVNPNVPKNSPGSFSYTKTSSHVANTAPYRYESFKIKADNYQKTNPPVTTVNKANVNENKSAINSILESSSKLDELLRQCREIGSSKSNSTNSISRSSSSSCSTHSSNVSVESKPTLKPAPKSFVSANPYKTVNAGKLKLKLYFFR
jgi:hypothetical protein